MRRETSLKFHVEREPKNSVSGNEFEACVHIQINVRKRKKNKKIYGRERLPRLFPSIATFHASYVEMNA